jgi:hypothetical protein
MAPIQNYIPTDVDHVAKQYDDWEAGRTRAVRPPAGKSVWFILPARIGASQGANPFLLGQYVHFVKDPRNPSNILGVGLCPSKTRNAPCAVCPFLSQLKKTGNAADLELAGDMSASETIICNAVRLDVDDPKVEILHVPATVHKFCGTTLRDKADGYDFSNPAKGKTVIIEKTGSGKTGTRYTARLSQKELALPNMAWLDQMNDLDKVFEELDQEAIGRSLAGGGAPPREPGQPAPASRQVGAEEQKQLPPAPDRAGAIDMVEDPITGEMVPRKK